MNRARTCHGRNLPDGVEQREINCIGGHFGTPATEEPKNNCQKTEAENFRNSANEREIMRSSPGISPPNPP
jgi:hypothetical protein